jgi:hypothetical protein
MFTLSDKTNSSWWWLMALGLLVIGCAAAESIQAQDTVTGAFEGKVRDSQTGTALAGAAVEITNQQTGLVINLRTDYRGRFYQGLLLPGVYRIRVSMPGYQSHEVLQRLKITYVGEVVPVPIALDPASAIATPTPASQPTPQPAVEDTDIRAGINATDGRRSGSFSEEAVSTLPLGGATLTRTFDELALLLPGVAPPPQTLGSVAGPGVGAGVGSAGQFAVNGLRSRANNFTVDGSDNNDEDIGVRRQGFVALVPQPIESIQEYQVITQLAPAQFGRNLGAQVNAVSKSGGNTTHGTVYGFFNSSQLNARNFFDTTNGNTSVPLRVGNQSVIVAPNYVVNNNQTGIVPVGGRALTVLNQSGGKDSFTFGQAGLVLGGPLKHDRVFYFVSAEREVTNATKEESFVVPTVEQRGLEHTGASGLFLNPFGTVGPGPFPLRSTPTTLGGDAIFSLYPFPNSPAGIYGANTFTQVLPASSRGLILSGKLDGNFKFRERQQSVTARYNFTDDKKDIPATGGAIFSSLRPRVRAQNLSFFLNGNVTGPNSVSSIFNQLRLSYGRTRLNFDELRDNAFQLAAGAGFRNAEDRKFLLNAPLLSNLTLPDNVGVPNSGPVFYRAGVGETTEQTLGAVGQVVIAGFSPVGVDVFNFPQRRVNNTYQLADQMTIRAGSHSFAFGTDNRRSELNSELPRNSRPLVTFAGEPATMITSAGTLALTNRFIRPETFAAASAANGFSQTLATGGESGINLRFYQLNFFAQDEWRVRTNLSLSYGLRYEYNTPPREISGRIEQTFNDPALSLVPGLRDFIGGRTRIFDPDRNNFAPRVGLAYAPHLFARGKNHFSVIRAGYGLFYDQILGAVVSQSRNVYPTYLTIDFAGGPANRRFIGCPFSNDCPFDFINPSGFALPGTINTLNPSVSLPALISAVNFYTSGGGTLPAASGFGMTIPAQRLQTPMAHHFSLAFEQELTRNTVISAAYVGTVGRHLLRFTTPNLGPNAFLVPISTSVNLQPPVLTPAIFGIALPPGAQIQPDGRIVAGRPVAGVGTVNRFETTASSRYDSFQLEVRGRFRGSSQYQLAYTLSKATDDVSDVFDLAGAPALPQDSLTFAGERGPANFDARHRFAYNFIYDLPPLRDQRALRLLFGGLQISGAGRFQTGQPFTVNSIFDVNLDGNLTDRLDNTNGIVVTGDRRQPLRLATSDTTSLLAPVGQDGRIGRNSFRAGSVLELDLAVAKKFSIGKGRNLIVRTELFNFINRANFGVPVRFLEAPGFGQATSTITPGRRIQFALKYSF